MKDNLVIGVGEALIDFFCTDIAVNLTNGSHFQKSAGGAPANVTAVIAKLGGEAAFIGKVGKDPFGYFLKETLEAVNVDTSMLVMDENNPTTLAFVSLKKNGQRDFVFHRGADALFEKEDVDQERLKQAKILHFGSATALLSDPFRSAYIELIVSAKNEGKFVSFDPNFRVDLWRKKEREFVSLSKKVIQLIDFVKVSDEELELITDTQDYEAGIGILHSLGAKIVAVTLGKRGTLLSNGETLEVVRSIEVNSIDSTGAGDAFVGAALFKLAMVEDVKTVFSDFGRLREIISFANKVGALVCTKIGTITVLPDLQEVDRY